METLIWFSYIVAMISRWASPLVFVVLLGFSCCGYAGPSQADLLQSLLKDLGIAPAPQQEISSEQFPDQQYIAVTYNTAMQPMINMTLGGQAGQRLNLVFATGSGDTVVFAKEKKACDPEDLDSCYSLAEALNPSHGEAMKICEENKDRECKPGPQVRYYCQQSVTDTNLDHLAHSDKILINGVLYSMNGVEAEDIVLLEMHDSRTDKSLRLEVTDTLPFRLSLSRLLIRSGEAVPPLFEGTSGFFGAGGRELSCRMRTIWTTFLSLLKTNSFALDFRPPERARLAFAAEAGTGLSRVLLNPVPRNGMVWSEPRQIGDYLHSGLHGFILYHPTICGAELLRSVRNTSSSNWFAVVDTAGPCLTLPPFLFDRIMMHIPVKCPFTIGEASFGRLCAPDRSRSQKRLIGSTMFNVSLPALTFTLEDERRLYRPTSISLALERLVFDANPGEAGDAELLCVARTDFETREMMHSHISFGSLVVAAITPEINVLPIPPENNLRNLRVGLSSRCNVSLEATDDYCAAKTVCVSPMQEYDESSNECQDPECSRYMFMTLDHDRKMCAWSFVAPVCLGITIVSLVLLDLFSHRLYKQAIERAKNSSQ